MGQGDDCLIVGEGRWVVERMLAANVGMEALLLKESMSEEFVGRVGSSVPVYVAAKSVIDSIVGFEFHRGVIAIGRRPKVANLSTWPLDSDHGVVAVGLLGVSDPENVGSLLRSSAAFGVRDIAVGGGTADPFRRRVIRVSMGSIFQQRVLFTEDWCSDLKDLRDRGVCVIATTLDDRSIALMDPRVTERVNRAAGQPTLLLLGNESEGLPKEAQEIADLCVRIPMAAGVDSLNVATAGTVALYELMRQRLMARQGGLA